MIARVLRGVAVGIAVAACADPAVRLTARAPSRIALVEQPGPRRSEARRIADAIDAALPEFDVVRGVDPSASQTIVIGDRYPAVSLHGRVSTVSLLPRADPWIAAAAAPRAVSPATAVRLVVDVERAGQAAAALLVIDCAGVEVARTTHAWSAGERRWRAETDAVPVGSPPFVFRVTLSTGAAAGATAFAAPTPSVDAAEIVVAERRAPLRVLVYEARPSWAAAFLRRALESDARFQVSAVSFPSRGVAVRAGDPPPLAASSLDEVAAVVVGGLDRLTIHEAAELNLFLRARGGAVVLVPDTRRDLELPAVSAIAGVLQPTETLLEQHAALSIRPPLPRVDVSEILTFAPPAGATPIASTATGAPVVMAMPRGAGALVVSGALDAWRFRGEAGVDFDAFWRTLVASLAGAAPPAIDVEVTPALVPPGGTARVTVGVRAYSAGDAVAAADDRGHPIRLWPLAETGAFAGTFTTTSIAGAHTLSVATTGAHAATARAAFVVGTGRQADTPLAAPLSLASAVRGGLDVAPSDVARLARDVRAANDAPMVGAVRHPMRSPWWLALFAACACGEWWLRRRAGRP